MLSRDSRQEKKWKAWRRSQFAYLQKCQRIDFEEDVLGPEIEAMKSGKKVAELPPAALFEVEFVNDEAPIPVQDAHATTADAATGALGSAESVGVPFAPTEGA